jgi:O-antigen ligase
LYGVEEGISEADLYLCCPVIFLAVVAMIFSVFSRSSFSFCIADLLVSLLFVLALVNYLFVSEVIYSIKLVHIVMMGLLYLSLRILLPTIRGSESFILMVLMVCAIMESVEGIRQAFGLTMSSHNLYKITGTFFNPGPYAGYLAITGSIAFAYLVEKYKEVSGVLSKPSFKMLSRPAVLLYLLCGVTVIIVLIVLPATMSRAAFVAVTCCVFVILYRNGKIRSFFVKLKSKCSCSAVTGKLFAVFMVIVLVGGLSFFLYKMKKDSADGRLLIWRVTTSMITAKPVKGFGIGEFSGEYAMFQKKYFEKNPNSVFVGVAGTPDYGFNDYLQIGAEMGIPAVLLLISLLVVTLKRLFSNRSMLAYGLLALVVFAFFSYPLSLFSFQVLLVLFCATGASYRGNRETTIERRIITVFVLIAWLIVALLVTDFMKEKLADIKTFKSVSYLYQLELYDDAIKEFLPLLPSMTDDKVFLFELGHSYNKAGLYEESNRIMELGTKISGDPMLYNIMGNNYKELGEYIKGEKSYYEAFGMLPNRIYPLYLLMILYEDTGEHGKALEMAKKIVGFDPKITSEATEEMKKEALFMLRH